MKKHANMKYTDIKTFEDACKVKGYDPNGLIPNFTNYPKYHVKAMIAHAKLVIIVDAANQAENNNTPWKPDWSNSSEYKYHTYFYYGSSGFSADACDYWYTVTGVGSRLIFRNREVAIYITTQFLDLYKEYFVMEKQEAKIEVGGKFYTKKEVEDIIKSKINIK